MSAPCWITRAEADPRYAYTEDTFDENAPLWSPNCGHEACLKEDALHKADDDCSDRESIGWGCPMAACRFETARDMCDLDKGHEGEHVFVATSEIVLELPETRTPTTAVTP